MILRRKPVLGGIRALWRIRLRTAVAMSLPVLFLGCWYASRAWASFAAHRELSGGKNALTAEIFHLHLHDSLRRDVRRMTLPPPPETPELPVVSLVFTRSALRALTSGLSAGSERAYEDAFVSDGGKFLRCRVRVRGEQPWHWAYPQKSLKIVMSDGQTLAGAETFNLLNEVAPISVGETVLLDILCENGILTPAHRMVRATINKKPMGVYLQLAQVDAELLRDNKRMYGSLYSGDGGPVDKETGLSLLWKTPGAWTKVASWKPAEKDDIAELALLLEQIGSGSHESFAQFASYSLDLGKFATFDAIDAVFGGNQHNWDENHKIYFDPYRGRFEPVAWNFRGWRHEPLFMAAENPLRLRLALTPGFVAMRNRIAFRLLCARCSVPEVRARLLAQLKASAREFAADPFWDAYNLLPPVDRELRRMVRPMDAERQALVLESEMKTFSERHAFLTGLLRRDEVDCAFFRDASGANVLCLTVGGFGAYRLESVMAHFGEGENRGFSVARDSDLDGVFDPDTDSIVASSTDGRRASFGGAETLTPAVALVARARAETHLGHVRATPARHLFRYFVATDKTPAALDLELVNEVTGWRLSRRIELSAAPPDLGSVAPAGDPQAVPSLDPGAFGVHPWLLQRTGSPPVRLGPGVVNVRGDRIFGQGEEVTIEPGTVIRLDKGASLIFRCKLTAAGTREEPIVIQSADPGARFGGVALQGSGSSGSRLSHVIVRGGSAPKWGMVRYPGMVNMHDATGIVLENCLFAGNRGSDDALHMGYCMGAVVTGCDFEDVAADALDIEFSDAAIDDCRFIAPPDDGLDLMSSTIRVTDSVFLRPGGNAISAGEVSRAEVSGCLVFGGRRGVLAKSKSEVLLDGSLLCRLDNAVRIEFRSPRYDGPADVRAEVLYAPDCVTPVSVDQGRASGISRIVSHMPRDGALDHLRRDVLGLESWDGLEEAVQKGSFKRSR